MAFRSNGPVMLALPAFRGFTRRVILVGIVSFFVLLVLASFMPDAGFWLREHLPLIPEHVVHGWVWQLLTYPFYPLGLISEFFALLSVWFIGSMLEDQMGSSWLREYFFATTVGGGLLASVFAWLSHGRAFGISGAMATAGLYPFVMALLLAFARYNAEQEVMFSFVVRIKAKYLAAIYLLFYLGSTIAGGDRFGALTAVCAALAGWLYLRIAPRRGLGFSASESWYGMRNAFLRNKRRRAAKKFEVYMRDQGREVHFDAKGKFVEDERKDPNDRRWMN